MWSSYSLAFHSSLGDLAVWSTVWIVSFARTLTVESSFPRLLLWLLATLVFGLLSGRAGLLKSFSSGSDWSPLGLHLSS
ncbi:hypothetical protein TNCV_3286671 [Trichonephila clavipes]|nr:hypothetical protein TNCV_3286671 [Trichonephila clavipes]